MADHEGNELPHPGISLEVVHDERLVFTDAFIRAREPSPKPFMTALVTFEDLGGGKTRYIARARHWTTEDREAHEKMGFHEGWGSARTRSRRSPRRSDRRGARAHSSPSEGAEPRA